MERTSVVGGARTIRFMGAAEPVDPVERLQCLLRTGRVEEAERALGELLVEGPVYFRDPGCRTNVPWVGAPIAKDNFVLCVGVVKTPLRVRPRCVIDHEGLRAAMGRSVEWRDGFMHRALMCAVGVDPVAIGPDSARWLVPETVYATMRATRRFQPAMGDESIRVQRWCLTALFLAGKIAPGLSEIDQRTHLGTVVRQPDHARYSGVIEHETRFVMVTMLQMRVLGMTDEEIGDCLYAYLERFADTSPPIALAGVAALAADCRRSHKKIGKLVSKMAGFDSAIGWRKDERAVILTRQAELMMVGVSHDTPEFHPLFVEILILGGMNVANARVRAAFRERIALMLATGSFAFVELMAAVFGTYFADPSAGDPAMRKPFRLRECAARAFDVAWRNGKMDIAGALVEEFGEEACLDPAMLVGGIANAGAENDCAGDEATTLAVLVETQRLRIRTAVEYAGMRGYSARIGRKNPGNPAKRSGIKRI